MQQLREQAGVNKESIALQTSHVPRGLHVTKVAAWVSGLNDNVSNTKHYHIYSCSHVVMVLIKSYL